MTRPKTKAKKKPAADAPVIDVVGAPPRVSAEEWAHLRKMQETAREVGDRIAETRQRFGLEQEEPTGVQIGGVPIALPPELARPVAAIHDQALGLVALGRELAAGVATFTRALEDARRVLEGRPRPRRRRRR